MELIDLFRVLNAVLAAGCLGFWIMNTAARWQASSGPERAVMVGVGCLLGTVAYLAGGAISDTIPPIARVLLLAAPLGFLLGALAWDRTHQPPSTSR